MRQYGPSCGDAALMEMAVKVAARCQSDNPTVTEKWVMWEFALMSPEIATKPSKIGQMSGFSRAAFEHGPRAPNAEPEPGVRFSKMVNLNLNVAFGSGSVRVRTDFRTEPCHH